MSRQEKDAELDRRIVALRKKNQALLRRYQVSGLPQGWEDPLGCHSLVAPHVMVSPCRLRNAPLGLGPGVGWVWSLLEAWSGSWGCVMWRLCPLVSHWCLSV